MAYSRKFLTVGAMGVAAFALIGAGATASFNDSVTAQQDITTGVMNMTIGSPEPGASLNGKTLTLKALGPVGSSFTSGPQTVTVTNNSDLAAKKVSLTVTAPTNNYALRDGIFVKIQMPTMREPVYNGLLAGLQGTAAAPIQSLTIPAHSSVSAVVTFYAGDGVPDSKDSVDGLPDNAQGSRVTPTFTVGFKG
jgi:predicted ribosomally synthesized peptide with SipW-like signal peptide